MVNGGFDAGWDVVRDIGWRGRRLVQSAAKPNMRRQTYSPEHNRGNGNNRIRPNYPIIALIRLFAVNVGIRFVKRQTTSKSKNTIYFYVPHHTRLVAKTVATNLDTQCI